MLDWNEMIGRALRRGTDGDLFSAKSETPRAICGMGVGAGDVFLFFGLFRQ